MTRQNPDGHATLTSLRLEAHGIAHPLDDAAAAVDRLLAVQAQDYAGALWSIGLRAAGSTAAGIEAAHETGEFVRSWPMRGTLHFVRPAELGWMLQLTTPRMVRSAAGLHRDLGLDDAAFARAAAVARDRLSGTSLDRADLLSAFDGAGIATAGQRGTHLLIWLAQHGVTVLRGRTEYALLDEWVPDPRRLDPEDALAELAFRYLDGHGPATVHDLAWWSSLPVSDARQGLAAVRDRLEEITVDGVTYHHRMGLEPAAPAVHLLPGFDEYLLGYRDRSAPLGGEPLERVVPGSNGLFLPTMVVDGHVVGTWRRTVRRGTVEIEEKPFHRIPAGRRRATAAAWARYEEFLDAPLRRVS